MWHPRELLLARVWRCVWRRAWRRVWRCVWRFLSSLRGQQRTTSTHSVPHTTDITSDITTDIYQPGRENVQSHLSTLLALEQDPRDEMLVDVAALPLPDDKAFAGSNVQAMQSLAESLAAFAGSLSATRHQTCTASTVCVRLCALLSGQGRPPFVDAMFKQSLAAFAGSLSATRLCTSQLQVRSPNTCPPHAGTC